MKKKATGKSKDRPASRRAEAKAKPKTRAAKPAKSSQAKAKPPAGKPPKAKGLKSGGAKAGSRPAAKKTATAAVKAKPAPKAKTGTRAEAKTKAKTKTKTKTKTTSESGAGKRKPAASGDLLRKVAPRLREESGRDTEVILAPELISRTLPETVTAEDEGALRKVMSSLTELFGGRDDLSDAELDALLDSKIASGEIPPSAALDPLDEAQSLVYEAWNSEGPQRVRLARKALETSPDCADAYVILAEEEVRDGERALELFRQGVEAGERAIGADLFRKSAGRFWDVMETRPYLRARLGLAECLWEQGGKEEAIGHLRDLLRLDPTDNQGVRKLLDRYLQESGGGKA